MSESNTDGYVPPPKTLDKLREYLKNSNFPPDSDIRNEAIKFLCNEIDVLNNRLDFFRESKEDKKDPKVKMKSKPYHFRGARD